MPIKLLRLRLSSSSCHWSIEWQDSSMSDGHWWLSLHLSMLLQNLVDLLWMSHAKSFVVSSWSLAIFWCPIHGYVCRSVFRQHDQPASSSMLSLLLIEISFQAFSSASRCSCGNWSVHDIPNVFQMHCQWKTSKVLQICAVNFHVSVWNADNNMTEV